MKASTSAARPSASSPICVPTACRWRPRRSTRRARAIGKEFGDDYLPEKPRFYSTKAKNAQEAHEAIRPTDFFRTPDTVRQYLDADQCRLYDLIWKRAHRQPDGSRPRSSAPRSRSRPSTAARTAGLRAVGSVVPFDGFLAAYTDQKEDDDEEDEDETAACPRSAPARRWPAREDQRDPALHRAAAALFRSHPDQEDGRARHRPSLDLCRDAEDAGGPRICHDRQAQADPGGQGPAGDGLPRELLRRAMSNTTSPPRSKRSSTRSPPASSPGRTCCATSGRISPPPIDDIKELRVSEVLDALNEVLAPLVFPAREDGSDPRICPNCGTGNAVAEARQVRRLHRLLELSRMPLHPPARRRATAPASEAARRRTEGARRGSRHRRGNHAAQRPLRSLCPARRRQGSQALQPAQGLDAGQHRPREGAGAAGAAARCRPASGKRQDDLGRPRPLRTVPPA